MTSHWVEVPGAWSGDDSLATLDVRRRTGASVVAVERAGTTTASPDPSYALQPGDRLLAVGGPDAIERLHALFAEDDG